MAPHAEKVAWSADEKRRLLDYIRDRKAKNNKASAADFIKTVANRLKEPQATKTTLKGVQEEVTAIVKNTRLNEKHTATNLWKSGPKILNLNHPYLQGVYSSKIISEISGVNQAAASSGRKRKPEESIDDTREKKRSRHENLSETSSGDSSGQDDSVKKTAFTKRAPLRQRNKPKPKQTTHDRRKTKRARQTSPLETMEDYSSNGEGTAISISTARTDLPKQHTKRAREEEAFGTKTRPAKKQKIGTNPSALKRTYDKLSTSEVESERSDETDDQSEAERPRAAKRMRVTLKLKGSDMLEPSQHDKLPENEGNDLSQTEHTSIMPNNHEDDSLSGSSSKNADGLAQASQRGTDGRGTEAATMTGENLTRRPSASVLNEHSSASPGPLNTADQEDLHGLPEIPLAYRQFGLDVSSPHYAKIPEDLYSVYCYVMMAVHSHLVALNIDMEQAVLIKDRAWDDDLAQLMATVFGHDKTAEELAKEFASIQSARVLPLHIFLRSLCMAAIMEWAFKPLPLGFKNDSNSRDARIVNALRRVLKNRFNEGVEKQIFFEATQYAIQKEIMAEVKVRAGIFAHRLFMALSPFFQSNQINRWTFVNDPLHLRPLTEAHKGFNPEAGMKQPATRDVQSYPESDANKKPLPGSTNFERDLRVAFDKALKTRYKWDEQHDGEYWFEFPVFKQEFEPGFHFNEEYIREESTADLVVPARLNNRVFVTTMFGVKASSRKAWTAEFTDFEVMSRPSVFNLD